MNELTPADIETIKKLTRWRKLARYMIPALMLFSAEEFIRWFFGHLAFK